jgi:hypothetical protein
MYDIEAEQVLAAAKKPSSILSFLSCLLGLEY